MLSLLGLAHAGGLLRLLGLAHAGGLRGQNICRIQEPFGGNSALLRLLKLHGRLHGRLVLKALQLGCIRVLHLLRLLIKLLHKLVVLLLLRLLIHELLRKRLRLLGKRLRLQGKRLRLLPLALQSCIHFLQPI